MVSRRAEIKGLSTKRKIQLVLFFFVLFCLSFCYFLGRSRGIWISQARGPNGPVATGPRQSHSNAGSEPCLRPSPQLTAMPDP